MSILSQSEENKGRVSSLLGKELATKVLNGDNSILSGALKLMQYNRSNVRSGAVKIIEKVAEVRPDMICDHLSELTQCMNYPEAQTRWMVLHIAGLCAKLNPECARDFFIEATKFPDKRYGTV